MVQSLLKLLKWGFGEHSNAADNNKRGRGINVIDDFDNEDEDETNDTNVDEEDDDNAQDDVSTCRKLSPRCEDGCSTWGNTDARPPSRLFCKHKVKCKHKHKVKCKHKYWCTPPLVSWTFAFHLRQIDMHFAILQQIFIS